MDGGVTTLDSAKAVRSSSTAREAAQQTTLCDRSDEDLRHHLTATSLLDRLRDLVKTCAVKVTEWTQVSSDRTVRQLEKQLHLAMQRGSADAYAAVLNAVRQRFDDPVSNSHNSLQFLQLYNRVLVNYGAFCLVNFETKRAASLLEEAIQVAERAQGVFVADLESRTGPAAAAASTVDYGATSVVYVRVLLANALACEQQYWRAVEQYQIAQETVDRHPYITLNQLAPGPKPFLRFSEEFMREEMRLFYSHKDGVRQAVAQGRAQLLLLQSQGAAKPQLMAVQLSLARLYRQAGLLKASQKMYENYLDYLVEQNAEDECGAMLELGRMLSFEHRNAQDAGLVYLETASEMLLEDAEEELKAIPLIEGKEASKAVPSSPSENGDAAAPLSAGAATEGAALPASCVRRCVRAAAALVDTALALQSREQTDKAIGVLERSLELLHHARLDVISAWVKEQYADLLASASLVDKALAQYEEAIVLLDTAPRHPVTGPTRQLAAMQRFVPLHAREVEAHLAYCLQNYVGDHRRAMKHYQNVFDYGVHSVQDGASSVSLQGRPISDGAAASGSAGGGRRRVSPSTSSSSNLPPRMQSELSPETLHWVLTNHVACCERVQDWNAAIAVQHRLIEIESAVGVNVLPSYLKLLDYVQKLEDWEKQLALCYYLLFLPEDALDDEARLRVAHAFAKCCYLLGNNRMGAVLLHAVQHVRDDDPATLLDYALCLRNLDPAEQLQLDGMLDIQTGVSAVAKVFRRTASIIVAHRVVDAADAAARAAAELPPTRLNVTDELCSLIALSRGAFFFHQHGFALEAEELYKMALSFAEESTVTQNEVYNRELSILLANYATLKLPTDAVFAEQLYERASVACPEYLEVAEVVADFYTQSGNYVKGSVHMKRVIERNPEAAAEMYLRLARLGSGPAWDTMGYDGRLEVLEHLVLGMGVAASRLPERGTATTAADFSASVDQFDSLLLDGVAGTVNGEAACLACYLVQTRLHKSKLLNDMYKHAIRRFPFDTAILVNYAKLCVDLGFHDLARKYYARAYGIADGDFCRTQCYANYLSCAFGDQQAGPGEVLYRFFLERNPQSAQAHTHYANYLAGVMPSPFKTESHFETALRLDPRSELAYQLYGHFVWACADHRAAYTDATVKGCIFDRAEQLFRRAAELDPSNAAALTHLGTFYANRKDRFEDAVKVLHQAHQLNPNNVDVVRQLATVLVEECAKVQREDLQRHSAAAKQGVAGTPASARLRSLTEATQQALESALRLDPHHRTTLEQYAQFAVTFLKDPVLAAELWRRIERLGRKD